MGRYRIRTSIGEKAFDFLNALFMVCFCLTVVYPFLQQINTSIATAAESMRFGLKLVPRSFSLASYQRIFATGQITRAYWFTILRTAAGTSMGMVLMSALAYPLAKRYLPLRNLWTSLVVITMFFSGGLIPTYFLIRNLGMINTLWSLIIPGLVEPFHLIIMRNYFMSLPEEMDESAKMDGATEVKIFTAIILPLSKPILATVALWTIVGHWNAWFDALIYIQTPRIKVVQLVLQRVLMESNLSFAGIGSDVLVGQATEEAGRQFTPDTIKAAILIVSTLPILCVYPFLQKYFVKGIMMGSLKG